jgi:hypothetical protein
MATTKGQTSCFVFLFPFPALLCTAVFDCVSFLSIAVVVLPIAVTDSFLAKKSDTKENKNK